MSNLSQHNPGPRPSDSPCIYRHLTLGDLGTSLMTNFVTMRMLVLEKVPSRTLSFSIIIVRPFPSTWATSRSCSARSRPSPTPPSSASSPRSSPPTTRTTGSGRPSMTTTRWVQCVYILTQYDLFGTGYREQYQQCTYKVGGYQTHAISLANRSACNPCLN